jgi:hypothetical protein
MTPKALRRPAREMLRQQQNVGNHIENLPASMENFG